MRDVEVDGFRIDRRPVTVAAFRRFVRATGHVTVAERPLDPRALPGRRPGAARARARSCSSRRAGRSTSATIRNWWAYVPGRLLAPARGPGSDTYRARGHPVDPRRARGRRRLRGLGRARRCRPRRSGSAPPAAASRARLRLGRRVRARRPPIANTWQGEFPWRNLRSTASPAPRRSGASRPTASACSTCAATSGSGRPTSRTVRRPAAAAPRRVLRAGRGAGEPSRASVIKGGSHLCAPSYCLRFRPAARQGEADRHLHEPHRLPLRRAALSAGAREQRPPPGRPAQDPRIFAFCAANSSSVRIAVLVELRELLELLDRVGRRRRAGGGRRRVGGLLLLG